ncbi:MAG: RNA polymerase sigma factor [Caldilineaceae bacterium]|nr:RNA polymerase sigma factor [Caldilineaceae bacterium]
MSTFQSEMVLGEAGLEVVGRRGGGARSRREPGSGTAAVAVKDRGGWPQSLISAARDGDKQAFQGLVEGHWGSAVRLACSIMQTEEAAADAVQEALIKVHGAMPRFKDGNFRAWLLRIVSNTCYDHLRSQKRRNALSLDQMIEESDYEASAWRCDQSPERYALRREQLASLDRLIEGLPSWYRDVVVLVDVHGYDYGEAAAHLQLPRGTVKSRLSRARAHLRNQLAAADLLS